MYFTILPRQDQAFPLPHSPPRIAEPMTMASHLAFAELSAAQSDHIHMLLHISCQLQDQGTTASAKPAMIQFVAEWYTMCGEASCQVAPYVQAHTEN